jgi:hypothetical protein
MSTNVRIAKAGDTNKRITVKRAQTPMKGYPSLTICIRLPHFFILYYYYL